MHCCEDMNNSIVGDDRTKIQLINYNEVFNEYGIPVNDGGSALILINYCPWCGKKLPDSERDIWFDKLESLGYMHPFTDAIPEKYKTKQWRNENN